MHLAASTLMLGLAAAATNHRIDVGKTGLHFEPNTTTAAVGDTIDFHFYPSNHSVAMGAFANPCQPVTSGGFFSGYVLDQKGASNVTFTITVNSTDPIWFYCTQSKHCEFGMAGVINPPSSGDTLSAYVSAAKSVTANAVAPASVFGGEIKTASGSATETHGSATATGSTTAAATGDTTATATGSTTATAASGSASATSTAKPAAAARLGGGVELGGLVAGVAAAMALL